MAEPSEEGLKAPPANCWLCLETLLEAAASRGRGESLGLGSYSALLVAGTEWGHWAVSAGGQCVYMWV